MKPTKDSLPVPESIQGTSGKYIVRWCGFDGSQRELRFKTYAGARTLAEALAGRFDGVEIAGRDGTWHAPVQPPLEGGYT